MEVQTGLFCVSAPCIRPLLHKVAPGFVSSISQTVSRTSNARSKTKASIYGNEIPFSSRIRGTNAYELHSVNDSAFAGNPKGTRINLVSSGSENGGWGADADDASQVAVLHARSKGSEIVKTISVTVTDGTSKGSEVDVSGETGVTKFEHV